MDTYTYPITLEREGRKYWAYSEDFPGVYGLGNSIDEAKTSILEAMRLYIEECRATHRFTAGLSTDAPRNLPRKSTPRILAAWPGIAHFLLDK
jgi:predicted RNase H-like HicB family nuclease